MDVTAGEQAKSTLLAYVEAEVDAEEVKLEVRESVAESAPETLDSSKSIVSQIRKKIRLERQQNVSNEHSI